MVRFLKNSQSNTSMSRSRSNMLSPLRQASPLVAKPIVAIYSTFLQRGYDQVIHDVAIQRYLSCLQLTGQALLGLMDKLTKVLLIFHSCAVYQPWLLWLQVMKMSAAKCCILATITKMAHVRFVTLEVQEQR